MTDEETNDELARNVDDLKADVLAHLAETDREREAAAGLIAALQATNEAQAREIAGHADAVAAAVAAEREAARVALDRMREDIDKIAADALAAARREGAQDMRERCAELTIRMAKVASNIADKYRGDPYGHRTFSEYEYQRKALDLAAAAIRAEPLP